MSAACEVLRSCRSLIKTIPGSTGFGVAALATNSTEAGAPRLRLHQVLDVAEDFSRIKVMTWGKTRKVAEIKANPQVTVFWQSQQGKMGWVSASGPAEVEPQTFKDKTEQPYEGFVITVCPRQLEVLNYEPLLMADTNHQGWIPLVLQREERGTWKLLERAEYGYDPSEASPVMDVDMLGKAP